MIKKMTSVLLALSLVALPLAAGIGVPVGIILSPQFGALAMAASTVIVAVNALALRGLRL